MMNTPPPQSDGTSQTHGSSEEHSRRSSSTKFIPNLTQLQEVVQELPNPEEWINDNYTYQLWVDDHRRPLEFVRKRITRGSRCSYRWIYEGKVLIRKREMQSSQ